MDYSNIIFLLMEVTTIMQLLQIEVRNTSTDGNLVIEIMDSETFKEKGGVQGFFNSTSAGREFDKSGNLLRYENPKVFLSPIIDSLIQDDKTESSIAKIYAQSVLVHELVHYLQKTYTFRSGKQAFEELYFLPSENEAFTVQAYYFLKNYAPEEINELENADTGNIEFRVALWNKLVNIGMQDSTFQKLFTEQN